MKIAVLRSAFTFDVVDEPIPVCGPDEVLVKVRACGVCTSELDTWQGRGASSFPQYPGHEVSGTVVEVGGEVTTPKVGDPVAVWTTGRGFAEFVAVKAQYCRVAAGVALEHALLEPIACAVNAVELADVRLGDDVVVIGAGFMGHLVQQLVALRGVRRLVVADARPDVLERAERLGADRVVDVGVDNLADVVAELTQGRGADVTFEVTGSQSALDVVGETTRMSGKVVLVGYHQGAAREIALGHWNWMAYQIVNAHFRDVATIMRGMTVGMHLLTAGKISLDGLVTHRFALDAVNDAFRVSVDKPDGFVKATVTMGGESDQAESR